ncbi:MAG: nodulation protein NfeD [Candidatus Sumerlaeota bacterium]|nr:nodulation protein NfeD [Candidatus Sumerlaeota bacterium]
MKKHQMTYQRLLAAIWAALVCAATPCGGTETTAAQTPPPNAGGRREVLVAKLDDQIINPVTARFIEKAIEQGEREGKPVLIQLDTPGGVLQSTREIVKAIFASRVPVITYVYPNGSRAASAGVFITMSSHVAAMAPGTHIGAATPVDISGRGPAIRPPGEQPATTSPSTLTQRLMPSPGDILGNPQDAMSEKVLNDTLAWIETIARIRGRNADWAKLAVSQSASITAQKALELKVVDIVAPDYETLFRELDGRKVAVEGGEFTLRTAGATMQTLELSLRQRILNALATPNVAYILLMIGLAGLFYEVTHPGLIVPGVVGGISLLLAALALNMLPTNYAAILLILAGIGLIIAEIKFTSYGLLTVCGAICFFFGSLALFDERVTGIRVSMTIILPVVLATAGVLAMLVFLVIKTHRRRPSVGEISFIGEIAQATTDLTPEGKVFYNGAYWDATSRRPAARGAKVRIVRFEHFHLFVDPE